MESLKRSDFGPLGERPRFDDSISQLIRSAERFISMQKFGFAREQLELARTLDPKNSYIGAIIERVRVAENQRSNPLSVSVGPEFRSGVKSALDAPAQTQSELQAQIRHLTSVAEQFMEKGSYEKAFDSLMKAYLLDPVSPYVISCEKTVLPAWQKNQTNTSPSSGIIPSTNFQRRETMSQPTQPEPQARMNLSGPGNSQLQNDQQKRLEALKLQKELERRERERALWRQASSPPAAKGSPAPQLHPQENQENAAEPKQDRGLFAKLKLGKFLNP